MEQRLDAGDLRFATASGRLRYAWAVARGTEIKEDLGIIANLETARRWRGTHAASILLTLTRILSLKVSHGVEYRNSPVPGLGRVAMRTGAALVLGWQQGR